MHLIKKFILSDMSLFKETTKIHKKLKYSQISLLIHAQTLKKFNWKLW